MGFTTLLLGLGLRRRRGKRRGVGDRVRPRWFPKTSQKTPRRDIDLALTRRKGEER